MSKKFPALVRNDDRLAGPDRTSLVTNMVYTLLV